MIDECSKSMEHWWNDTDRRKNLYHCHFVRHKSCNDRPGIQTGPPRQEATTTEAYKTETVAQTFKTVLPPWPPYALTPKWAWVDSWPPSARYCCVLPMDCAAHWSFTQAAEHFASLDYGSLKCRYLAFSWTEPLAVKVTKPPTHYIEIRRDQLHFTEQNSLDTTVNMLIELYWHDVYIYWLCEMIEVSPI
jgi:hypothetical protein